MTEGDQITVVASIRHDDTFTYDEPRVRVVRAYVLGVDAGRMSWTRNKKFRTSNRFIRECDEGITWARGWTSKAAEALRVTVALS